MDSADRSEEQVGQQPEVIPRRSVLYVPGSNLRALAKAASLPADALILDLEDAVAPSAKAAAREAVAATLAEEFDNRRIAVRINAGGTPWQADDLAAAAGAPALLLPKATTPADVAEADGALAAAGSGARLWLMVETPGAVLELPALVGASDRVEVLVMGTQDLATALRLPADPTRAGLATAMARTVLVARDTGCDVIDGVFTSLTDTAGFEAECRHGRALGFDGKTVIHPGQIETANRVFGPSGEDLLSAERLVAAWDERGDDGHPATGVIVHEGRMIERLHVEEARRRLALARAGRHNDGGEPGGPP
ncbi:MAG: HpcH/HpaI aldolase/citrate lyase family protein [Nocardioides sp.]